MEQKPLTINQEKFAREYVLTGNASEAYRRAYPKSLKWKAESVNQKASAMLSGVKVLSRVRGLQAKANEKFEITAENLLQEQNRIAKSDYRKLFSDGRLLSPEQMPDDIAAAVSSVKVRRVLSEDGAVEEVIEVKLWNKNTALDSLFKNKGLYEKDNDQNGTNALADAIKSMVKSIDGTSKGLPNA